MKRRKFLAYSSSVAVAPFGLSLMGLAQKARAESPNYSAVRVSAPSYMPQIINIFMYGGASELAGNLTNIADINEHSQNSYVDKFSGDMTKTVAEDAVNGQITEHGFWKNAGGEHMEDMLASNDMTVYRTIYKKKNPTRSHRDSIFMFHKGSLGLENSPGIGSRLALMMEENRSEYEGARLADHTTIDTLENLSLPFVSFEGDSQSYAVDPSNAIPFQLRPLTMSSTFSNPYERSLSSSEVMIDALAQQKMDAGAGRFGDAWRGFKKRDDLVQDMDLLQTQLAAVGTVYPGGSFSDRLKAAVTLAIHNPQTLYMAVGTPGLGGWDDHNNGVNEYPDRMNLLMESIKAAMVQINASVGAATPNGGTRRTAGNIIINVFGDFGRLVNLNGSDGWDHGNNQNLYTFGGSAVRPSNEASMLGEVVGETERRGTTKTNNQYTVPTASSLTWEPMSIAASIYQYFGAENPEVMTASSGDASGDVSLADKLPT